MINPYDPGYYTPEFPDQEIQEALDLELESESTSPLTPELLEDLLDFEDLQEFNSYRLDLEHTSQIFQEEI